MSLGLTLTATISRRKRWTVLAVRDWLARAAVWFEAVGDAVLDAHLDRDRENRPHLRVHFHPAADPIDARLTPSGRFRVSARTTPTGPGYHIFLCALLRQFASDFEFEWDEPPGDHDPGCFFVQGDQQRLRCLFGHWLAARGTQLLTKACERPIHLGLPRGLRYLHPGPVLTPLGPRSLDWLKTVSTDETAAQDFFAWLEPELNANFYRGRALTSLWLDFPFRPPLTEQEGEQADQIAADLANALDANDSIDLPWAAWLEVMQAIEADGGKLTVEPISPEVKALVAERAASQSAEVGYRRYPVTVPLTDGWRIEVPGRFACRWSDDGRTWNCWDESRTIWFRSLAVEGQSAAEALAVGRGNLPRTESSETILHRSMLGEAVFGPYLDEDKLIHRLSGITADDGQLAACNIYIQHLDDKPWAVAAWQTLHRE